MELALTGYKRSSNKGGGPVNRWHNTQTPPVVMSPIGTKHVAMRCLSRVDGNYENRMRDRSLSQAPNQ
jgi:hypothetical protein